LIYGALANGVSCFSNAQPFEGGTPFGGGVSGMFGVAKKTSDSDPLIEHHTYNFGHRRSVWYHGVWTKDSLNEVDSPLPDYYLGYANHFRAFKRAFGRIDQIYDTNASYTIPMIRFTWLDAYSTSQAISPALSASDSTSKSQAFLKCYCTTSVKRWARGSHNEYIDSFKVGSTTQLAADSSFRTYVEVGLFKDSISTTTKNYAALVVNTRLWPSLRDSVDTAYYNNGLDSLKDHCHSTLGDIDTRKVWFHIDTSMMDAPTRANYYVVHDLWHPDSTWLVKNDSSFAIYLKPGDARFLYFQPGIAIRMAKTAATEEVEYAFNNGRRVAEIDSGNRTVSTYVRNGRLYVSYPRKGATIEGYNERSAGDNIATGNEVCIDSSSGNRRPSISAGMNDSTIAIVYWNSLNGGQIRAAYQRHPDSAWQLTQYTLHVFADTTTDGSGVTPVITPYSEIPPSDTEDLGKYKNGNDSIWWVAATYRGTGALDPQGIAALRLRIFKDSISFIPDAPMQYFYKNPSNLFLLNSAFPTITSRPLIQTQYPVRLAWQSDGKIFYNRFKDVSGTITNGLANPFVVSDGLPSFCYNKHPCIAMWLLLHS